MNDQALGRTLRKLAHEIDSFRPSVIGEQISGAVTGPSSGTIVGKSTSVSVGPGSSGNVVGSRISVAVGPRDPEELKLIQELRQEAAKAESNRAASISPGSNPTSTLLAETARHINALDF